MGQKKHKDRLTRVRRSKLTWPERADLLATERLFDLFDRRTLNGVGKIGNIGDQPPLLILSAAAFGLGMVRGDRRLIEAGLRMTAAVAAAIGLKTAGKKLIRRSRPEALLDRRRYLFEFGTGGGHDLQSFPSGHTAGAVALARAVGRVDPALGRLAMAGAVLIGVLQLPRLAHFPTDILAGFLLGVAAEAATHGVREGFAPEMPKPE